MKNTQQTVPLNICLFNAIYVSCNQLPNYPLGRYRSSFYEYYLSNTPLFNELTLSINSSTSNQLDICLNSFLEHKCNQNSLCIKYCQLAKTIFIEQQQVVDDSQSLSNTLRSVSDRKLNRYRDQVFLWLKQICETFISSTFNSSSTKINDTLLHERLIPMTRATFIRELTETIHWKRGHPPDLALIYRVYSESGAKIPLSDWFEVRINVKINYSFLLSYSHLHRY
jgi:hypothetical protein